MEGITLLALHPENGKAALAVETPAELTYQVMSELAGEEITSEAALFRLLGRLSETARSYAKLADALQAVEEKGYGIVMPDRDALRLEEPKIVRQSGGYGVKLRASARSIHMIKAEIETELCPTVGTEAETEELVKSLLSDFEQNPTAIWSSQLFGKSLYELIGEGVQAKLAHMPEDSRVKLSETMERIINEGAGGLICILL